MLPAERRQYILDRLYENKAIAVNDMAEQLDVTPMTIRRDLQAMEAEGLLKKSHGGAVLAESIVKEATYVNRKQAHTSEKQRIAAAALPYIESSMSIYMDAGTTSYELAKLMVHRKWRDVTVVTNDLAIGELLTPISGIHVIMIGGSIDAESVSTCGLFAVEMVRRMHFDLCFLGTQAITSTWRVMTANAEKIALKQACLAAADTSIIIADHSKMGKHKLYDIFTLTEADILITDYEASDEEKQFFQEHDLTYIHA